MSSLITIYTNIANPGYTFINSHVIINFYITFNTISKASGNGSICIYTHGFYAIKQYIDQNVGYSDETKKIIVESIVINNIIELSKRDYYDYCSKH